MLFKHYTVEGAQSKAFTEAVALNTVPATTSANDALVYAKAEYPNWGFYRIKTWRSFSPWFVPVEFCIYTGDFYRLGTIGRYDEIDDAIDRRMAEDSYRLWPMLKVSVIKYVANRIRKALLPTSARKCLYDTSAKRKMQKIRRETAQQDAP